MKTTLIASGLLAMATTAFAQEKPVLTIYTYDSFVSDWGPGPVVKAAFEETCECTLEFVSAGDGAALMARLKLEGARTDADIVLGLDTNLTQTATDSGLFAEYSTDLSGLTIPLPWTDPLFVPFDWGYFAFVHNNESLPKPPKSFKELADSDLKIVIQDPRSSTPGLGLLLWVELAYGEEAPAIWEGLSDNILTVTKGWSEAYGIFLDGEADMVLSYTTSPAYHLIAEEDDTKSAAPFTEGHYMQIEVAGKIAGSDQPELADAFLTFMVSEAFQNVISTTNWMYPAATPRSGLPAGFETLMVPQKAMIHTPDVALIARDKALQEWLTALSK